MEKKVFRIIVDDKHCLESIPNSHVIQVRENESGRLVAYSATQADLDSSTDEFIRDYFPDHAFV